MRTLGTSVALGAVLLLVSAGLAMADDLHLCDNNTTGCSNGALTATTSTHLYVNGSVGAGEDLYLVALAPTTGTGTDTFTSSNGFYTAVADLLGVTLSSTPSQPTWSPFDSNFTGAGGSASATGFDVTLDNLGFYSVGTTLTAVPVNATIPAGDAVLLITYDPSTKSVDAVSPYSSDFLLKNTLTASTTPEPASMALFGVGLLAIGFGMRKRLFA